MDYTVDLISWKNDQFVPQKSYNVFIDVRHNMERLAPLLNKDCVKIQHIDLCHMLYNNYAEARRLLELQQRKGVTLPPRRFERPNLGIEHADCATIIGNEFAMNTFRYANKSLYRVPVTNAVLYPSPQGKDFETCHGRYLWLGNGGLVRKGLDLVLDAFAEMPEYHLTVCGPIQQEKDFTRAYYRELYETANIHTVGWVDISSPEFMEITSNCVGFIYPSCSEAQCGAVITCLHAGLIPIISYESDVNVHDFGLILKDCSVKEIQSAIRMVSSLSVPELKMMAQKAWEYAQAHHTREKFAQEYRKVIETVIATHGTKESPLEIPTSGDAVGTSNRTSPKPSLASGTLSGLNLS
jgi:glycosyltransferase involved in cell wall biosynthesis